MSAGGYNSPLRAGWKLFFAKKFPDFSRIFLFRLVSRWSCFRQQFSPSARIGWVLQRGGRVEAVRGAHVRRGSTPPSLWLESNSPAVLGHAWSKGLSPKHPNLFSCGCFLGKLACPSCLAYGLARLGMLGDTS